MPFLCPEVGIFLLIFFGSELFVVRPPGVTPFQLPAQSRLVLASVLASTDTVAPMAFISATDFPQLCPRTSNKNVSQRA